MNPQSRPALSQNRPFGVELGSGSYISSVSGNLLDETPPVARINNGISGAERGNNSAEVEDTVERRQNAAPLAGETALRETVEAPTLEVATESSPPKPGEWQKAATATNAGYQFANSRPAGYKEDVPTPLVASTPPSNNTRHSDAAFQQPGYTPGGQAEMVRNDGENAQDQTTAALQRDAMSDGKRYADALASGTAGLL